MPLFVDVDGVLGSLQITVANFSHAVAVVVGVLCRPDLLSKLSN